jgi:Metal binding domain of Ada
MLQVDPGKDHSFEISKNMRILPGSYNCTLEVTGPKGPLAHETRKCKLAEPNIEPVSWGNPIFSDELAIKIAEQKYQDEKIQREAKQEMARKEAIQEKETAQEDGLQEKKIQEKETSNESKDEANEETEALEVRASSEENIKVKEDLGAYADENRVNNTSRFEASLKKSTVPPTESETELIGSSTSKKYHLSSCRFASKIKPDNKISFKSIEDAKRQGYLPCKVCNP